MPKAKGYQLRPWLFNEHPYWNRIHLTQYAINILKKIEFLHRNNILIGDINPQNILVQSESEVYFVDTDSYQIDNYPCPVGTPHFTPPELTNKDYATFLRTIDNELFAVATLLFMIFLPGKAPYACQDGGSPTENILNKNFSYPFGDDANFKTPVGPWQNMWNQLPVALKQKFYKVFKEEHRIRVSDWIDYLTQYLNKMQEPNSPMLLTIFPHYNQNLNISTNMNRRDIKSNLAQQIETVLIPNATKKVVGILELSTKAVKLLVGDIDKLQNNGFDFDYFPCRDGHLTNTGKGLDGSNNMDLNFFRTRVLPAIQTCIRDAKNKYKVTHLYTIATAAYRTANNRDDIVKLIENECKIHLKILDKTEESLYTKKAFEFSYDRQKFNTLPENTIVIDQGGGSTEISIFKNNECLNSYSLQMGTSVLTNVLFVNSTSDTNLAYALSENDKIISNRVDYYYRNHGKIENLVNPFCISVGSAVTKATNKKTNRNQHCCILTKEKIQEKIATVERELIQKYTTVGAVYTEIVNNNNLKHNQLDNHIAMRLGLPMILNIMEKFDINEIVVSGTGLWYGIYVETCHLI